MSMSSLSAQLASLNGGGGKNAGSSLATSRRHEDAVGRGISHSTKHGHTLSGGSSAKHKPSVLYADSKSASDVPLTTLRENCVSSLRQLAKLTENDEFISPKYLQTLAGVYSLQFERGLATTSENDKMDVLIGDLLALLSTAMGESSSTSTTSCFSSSLHVLEYLLRRYDVHLRESCMERLLICVLPFHEEPLFGRVLQLLDLARLPTYTFLRPFAAEGAPPPTRTILAKRASRDTALIKVYCEMAKSAAEVHALESDDLPRRGISRVISFAAAVLLEALSIQTSATGSISKSTLRTLLPFVLSSCGVGGNKCPDWRGFGQVLASCVAEECVLSTEAREALATCIVKGAAEIDQSDVELVVDCLATLMTVLSVSPNETQSNDSKLAMLPSRRNADARALGYSLPIDTYKALIKLDSLSEAVGHLYIDRNLVVTPLVASIVALATSRLPTDETSVDIVLSLIRQGQLEPLWKNPTLNLTASLASRLLKMAASLDFCTDNTVDAIQSIIEALKVASSTGCDAGIAFAVTSIGKSAQDDDKVARPILLRILGLEEMNINEDIDVDDAAPVMLPPRVGLEHADASVRLNAIEILARGPFAVESGGESLEQALLRHFITEDELKVAIAAGEALAGILGGDSTRVSFTFAKDCVKALEKWTLLDNKNVTEERSRALEVALDIAGLVVLALGENGHKNEVAFIQHQLLRGIIAHLDVTEAPAGSALLKALGRSRNSKKNAKNLLLTTKLLRNGLRSCWDDEKALANGQPKDVFFRSYLAVYSSILVGAIESSTKTKSREYVSDALNACLLRVQSEEASEAETLGKQLNTCATHIASVDTSAFFNTIIQLSSVPSMNIYKAVCITSINRLCDEYATGHGLSKLRVLMEAALRPDLPELCALRFISLASDCIADEKSEILFSVTDIIVYALALLGHAAQSVRKSAVDLVETARAKTAQTTETASDELLFSFLSNTLGTTKTTSQIIMDGPSALPGYLAALAAKSNHPQKLTIELLKSCRRTACSIYLSAEKEKRWLTLNERQGGCFAAAAVLKALEFSGEATAPLMCRYNHAGKGILDELLEDDTEIVPESAIDVVHCVARMMKGVIVNDAASIGNDSVIISTGPSRRGTRARSYSINGSPGVSFIDPYPNSMYTDILSILSYTEGDAEMKKELCQAVLEEVVGSPSWGEAVFKTMSKAPRKRLLELLLNLWKSETIDSAADVFLVLNLDGKDISNLLSGDEMKTDLSSIIFLSDYVHAHSKRLRECAGYNDILSLLFNALETISSIEYSGEEEDEAEFGRQRLLRVIVGLVSGEDTNVSPNLKKKIPKNDLRRWASLLVALIGGFAKGNDSRKVRALPFGRPKSLAFSVLMSLCSCDPKSITPMLVPAMLDSTTVGSSSLALSRPSNVELRLAHDIFISVVPIFFKYADAAGLNQFDLYSQFLAKATAVDEKQRAELHSCMVDAVMAVPVVDVNSMSLVGSFIAALIAFDISNSEPMETSFSAESYSEILRVSSPMAQVSALTQMISFAYHLMTKSPGDDQKRLSMNGSTDDLEAAILFASKPAKANQRALRMKTTLALLSVVSNLLTTSPVATLLMNGDESASKLSLNLWQDLLLLQSASLVDLEEVSEQLSEECHQLINTSLEQVQSMLPAHLFLASAALLIEDGTDTELCSRAIRLVADRAAETDPESPEASLFLDMLPMLGVRLGSSSNAMAAENTEGHMLVQQAVLVAVEIFARALCLKSNQNNSERLDMFAEFPKQASGLIKLHGTSLEQRDQVMSEVGSASCQVLCSAALCVSTLVRLLTVRSITILPDLVVSLVSVLCSVNQALASSSDQWTSARKSHAGVLQISILRPLLAISGSLPQFLGPYLGSLLSPSAVLSPSLLMEDTEQQIAVSSLASQLGDSLSKKIAARQLIPALSKSVPRCTSRAEFQTLLAMMKKSVQESPRSEMPPLRSWILKTLTVAYEFRGEDDSGEATDLVVEANDVLLAMVMKLSEAQLRPMYAKLREWRGDLDADTNSSDLAVKRRAFWCMSSLLSSQLRTIFLPCLSTVVSDAVDELEMAASQLTGSNKKKIDDGRKRQRLDPVNDNTDFWSFLKPLLSSLESALHADAVEGGKWVRHDDSQRYHSLMSPLSKLLELRSPSTSDESESFYQQVVHGTEGETGSVIGCLTALASAAGNEQLWKPLNLKTLQACGNERAEVRKGGVSCLLSLIKALGEEYMVLLPECLPVLSELLEDTDEVIANLAKECVTMGESLLGESLQDSLR